MRKIIIILFSIILVLILFFISCQKQNTSPTKDNSVEKLKSLPYLIWVPMDAEDKLKSGVTLYDEDLSFKGANIYNSRHRGVAHLIDMEGNILHNWSADKGKYHQIKMNEQGDLFAIVKNVRLIKLDWDSNIIWTNELRYHHDLDIAENGDIYSITTETIEVPYKSNTIPIENDYIITLSPDGKVKKKISILHLMEGNIMINQETDEEIAEHFKAYPDEPFDPFHTNSIEIIKRDINGFAHKGDLLISIREWSLIAVIDIEKEKLVWSWGENILKRQHHPTLLDNGNIMIFDNGGNEGYSRIVGLNPIAKEIAWMFQPVKRELFYSGLMGGNQMLPNGNLLITESDSGRIFEVSEVNISDTMKKREDEYFFKNNITQQKEPVSSLPMSKEGKIVWEFWNPEIRKAENKRAAIHRMMRFDPEILSNLPFDKKTIKYLKVNKYID